MGKFQIINLIIRLSKYFKEYWKEFLLALVMLLVTTGTILARPVLIKLIIDKAIASGTKTELFYYSGIFFLLLVVGVIVGYAQIVVMSKIGLKIINKIKSELFNHVLNLDLAFFDKNQTGWLISRVESDTEQLKNFCSHITITLITNVLMFAGIIVILYISNPLITMYMIVVLIFLFMMIFFFLWKIRTVYEAVREKYAMLTGFISEYVQGISIIQHYNQSESIRLELKKKSEERYLSEVRASTYEYGFWAFVLFLVETVLLSIILYFGITDVINGKMSIGTLIMFIEFSRQLTWPIITFSEIFNSIQRAFVSGERIFSIMDKIPKIKDDVEDDENDLDVESISFKDINFSYKKGEQVLKNINFTVKKGEKIALVGASGSGKSTTANLLCRFYDPDDGEIIVNNKNLKEFSLKKWRRSIGLVLQEIYFFPGTILDNIRVLDKTIGEEEVKENAKKMKVHEYIEKMHEGYDTELVERGGNLSVGEKQLLSFTRALSFNPSILILDEATASVDPYTEKTIQEGIEKLLDNRTAIIVAHRLSTIRNVDKILVFDNGEIVERGNHDQLMEKKGIYERLYSLQFTKKEVTKL
jgi:ATP-binding cassette subfamily B protein